MVEEKEQIVNQALGKDGELVYDRLTEILSNDRPVEDPVQAFNYASTLSDVLYVLKRMMNDDSDAPVDQSMVSEMLSALEVLARRLMQWEGRTLGMDVRTCGDVKFIRSLAGRAERLRDKEKGK